LLTGQNSEVLEYNQNYDGLYYSIHSISTSAEKEGTRKQNSSQAPTQPVNTSGDSDPSGGGQNDGSKLADSVRSMLYSPADLTIGKIKIIGDPDFLMTSPGVKNKAAVAKVYGSSSDGSVDPLVGQTFVEMKFNMASDYAPNGLLDVSDQLQFYKSNRPKSAGIEGIVYQVYKVESSFSRGSFTQWLEAFMPLEDSLVTGTENNTPAEQRKESGDYAAKSGSSSAAAASNEMLSNPADQDGARRETSNTETTKITTEVRKENNSTEQSTTTSNESKPVDTAVAKEEQSPNDETYTGASSYYGEDYDNSGREDTKEA
jgi:hypothetical protein